MDDLNSTISSILGDPQKMEQLRAVAQSLGIDTGAAGAPGGQPAQNTPPPPSGSPGGEEPSGDTQVEPLPGKALASTGDSAAAPAALALAIAAAVAAMIAQTKLRRRHDSLNR